MDIFKKQKNQSIKLTRETFNKFYELYYESLMPILEVKDFLIQEVKEDYDKNFNKAFLVLLSKTIQHIESIFILNENGLYGDAFVILRSILSEMNMIYYLHFKPELIEIFLKEKDDDYQINKNFSESFNEGVIDRVLKENNIHSIKKSFQLISKASHASTWGAQFYGRQAKTGNQFYVKYGPGFDMKKSLSILCIVISTHWDYLNMILWHRRRNKLIIENDFWKSVIRKVDELRGGIIIFSDFGENIIKNFESIF